MEKQSKPIRKIMAITMLVMSIGFFTMILFSPYGRDGRFPYKVIQNTVEINAAVEQVYAFLGNSASASRWSAFVHHITPLNADLIPDGEPGSTRRCFHHADEKGLQWDELIAEVVPNQKRQLTIYNLVDFPMVANNLATEQLYESLGANQTRLTFTVFYKDAEPTMWETIKTYIAAYRIKSLFKSNMTNIKRIVEEEAKEQAVK